MAATTKSLIPRAEKAAQIIESHGYLLFAAMLHNGYRLEISPQRSEVVIDYSLPTYGDFVRALERAASIVATEPTEYVIEK